MKKNQLIQHNIKIKTCTPLHIGSGKGTLKNHQYIYDPRTQTLTFIDEHKWIDFITRKRLWNQFTEFALAISTLTAPRTKNTGRRPATRVSRNLLKWLQDNKITDKEIATFAQGIANAYPDKNSKDTLNEIHPTIAEPDGTLYIPGSTIKGFVRSAILHHLITKNKSAYRKEWDEIKRAVRGYKRSDVEKELGKIITNIEDKAFLTLSKIKENIQKENAKTRNLMTASAMRGILISDAIATKPRSETPTIIVQKIDVSQDAMKESPMPLFRECITPNTEFTATITLDTAMTSTIGINNLADLEKILFEYLRFAYAKQKEVFGPKYRKTFQAIDSANLSLGGGTGFHVKTLIRTLAPNEEEARKVTVDWMKLAFRQHKHEVDRKISPRTLKITRMEAQAEFMGLCTLTEE